MIRIEASYLLHGDAAACLAALSALLRQVSLRMSEEENTGLAGLTGEAWLQWLDRCLDKPDFSQGSGRLLLVGPYQKSVDKELLPELFLLCHKWVKCI